MFKKLKVALAALLLVATSATLSLSAHAGSTSDTGSTGGSSRNDYPTTNTNDEAWRMSLYVGPKGYTDEYNPGVIDTSISAVIGAHVTLMKCDRATVNQYIQAAGGDKKKAVNQALKDHKFDYVYKSNNNGNIASPSVNNSFYLTATSNKLTTRLRTYVYNYNPVGDSFTVLKGGGVPSWREPLENSNYICLYTTPIDYSGCLANNMFTSHGYNLTSLFNKDVFKVTAGNLWYCATDLGADALPDTTISTIEKVTSDMWNGSFTLSGGSTTKNDVVIWFVEPLLSTDVNLEIGTASHWSATAMTPQMLANALEADSTANKGLGGVCPSSSDTLSFLNFCGTNGYAGTSPMSSTNNSPASVFAGGYGAYAHVVGWEDEEHLADMPEIPSIPIFYKDKDGKLTYSGSSSTVTKEAWNEIYPVISYALHLSEDEPKTSNLYNSPGIKTIVDNLLKESKQAKDTDGKYRDEFLTAYNNLWTAICNHYSNTMIDVSTGSVPKRVNNNDPTTVTSLPGDWDGPFEIDTTLGTVADTDKPINGKKATIYAAHPGNSDLEIVSKTTTSMSALPTEVGKSVSVADVLKNPYEYAIVIETGSDIVDEDGDPEPPNIVVYDEDQDTVWNTSIPKEDFNAFKTDLKYAKGFPGITWNDTLDDNAKAKSDLARNAFEVLMSKGSYDAYNENPRSYLNDSGWDKHAKGTSFEEMINDSAAYYNSLTAELDHWNKVKEADEKFKDDLNNYINDLTNSLNNNPIFKSANNYIYNEFDDAVFITSNIVDNYNFYNRKINQHNNSIFNDKTDITTERYKSGDPSWHDLYKSYIEDNFYNVYSKKTYVWTKPSTMYDTDTVVKWVNYNCGDFIDGFGKPAHEFKYTITHGNVTQDMSHSERRPLNSDSPGYKTPNDYKYTVGGSATWGTHGDEWTTKQHTEYISEDKYYRWWDDCYCGAIWVQNNPDINPYNWSGSKPWEWCLEHLATRYSETQLNAYNDLISKLGYYNSDDDCAGELGEIGKRISLLKNQCTEYEEARIDYMKKLADAEEALKDGFDVYLVQAINGAGPNGTPQLENNVTDSLVKRNDSNNSTNQEGYKTWQSDLYMYNSLEFIENSDPKMMKYGALNTNTFAQNSNLDADVLNKGVFSSYAANDCTTSIPKTPYKLPEVNDTPIKSELDARVGADDPNSDRAKMPLRYRVVYSDSPYKHMDEDTIKAAASKSQVLTELTYDMLFDAPYSYGIILNGVGQKDDKIEIKEYEINYVKNSSLSKNLNKLFFSSDNTVTMNSTTNNSVSTTKVIKSFTYDPNDETYVTTKFDTSTDRIPHLWLSANSSITASFDKTDSNDNSDDSRPTDNNNSNPSVLQSNYNSNYKTLNNDKTTAALFIDSLWKNETTGTVETSTSELLKTYITNNSYRSNSNSNSIYGDEFLEYDCANGTEFDFWRTQCSEGLKLATVYRMYKSRYNTTETNSNSNEYVPQPVGNNGAIPDGHSAASAGWVPVWATNPDDRTVDYMDYEVHISYQPTLKITSTFSTDEKDMDAMSGLLDASKGVPYLKAGQAFEGEITNNRLIIDGYCNVGGNTDYIRGGTVDNLRFRDKDEFYAYMNAIVDDLSNCKMGVVSTIPEFNVYTNNTKIILGGNTSVKYTLSDKADGDAGIVFKTEGADSTNRTEFYSVYDVTDYGVKPKYAGTPNDSDYNSNIFNDNTKHDGCYYGSSTQSMYDSLLEHNKGTNGWYWEYSEGLYYAHYHAEINYNKGDTDGKKTFSAVISKYNSQSTDENADDYLLKQGSVKSGFTSAFGYVDNSQYRSLDGKDSYVLAPFIDLRDLTTDKARELFVNQSTGGNNLNGILGQQTPIHIRGNVYDNT